MTCLICDLSGDCFLIQCPDSSMHSIITYEDKIIVNTQRKPKDGDVVLINFDKHILLRKYYKQSDDTVKLISDSNLFDKEVFKNDEFRIIGVVVGNMKNY
jgi:repressor LexA